MDIDHRIQTINNSHNCFIDHNNQYVAHKKESCVPAVARRLYWVDSIRILLMNFLVLYHCFRFFDGARNWVRIIAVVKERSLAHESEVLFHSFQRFILQIGLNMFFLLAGTALYLSMRIRGSVWKLLTERCRKLLLSFVFGYIIMALPMIPIMLACKGYLRRSSDGEFSNLEYLKTRDLFLLFLKTPMNLYFLPYLFILGNAHLPLLYILKELSTVTGQSTVTTFHSFYGLLCLFSTFGFSESFVFFYLFTQTQYIVTPIYAYGRWPLYLFLIMIAVFLATGRYHQIRKLILQIYLSPGCLKYPWMFPITQLSILGVLIWANEWFKSPLMNTGVLLIYYTPLLLIWFRIPPNVCLKTRWGLIYFNTSIICLFIMVAAHLAIVMTLPSMHPDKIPYANKLFGYFKLDKELSQTIAKFFFTIIAHSDFLLVGYCWLLFSIQKRLPNYLIPPFNTAAVIYSMYSLFLLRFALLDRGGFVFVGVGWTTYIHRWERFWFLMGSWTITHVLVYGAKVLANFPFDRVWEKFLLDATFPLFLIHPLWQYGLACYLRDEESLSWWSKAAIVTIGTFIGSYLSAGLMLRFSYLRRMFGIKDKPVAVLPS